MAGSELGASLWTFLVQHGHELLVDLVLPDLGAVDERGGADLVGAAATDEHPGSDGTGDPQGGTADRADRRQDTLHGRYFLTLRVLVSQCPATSQAGLTNRPRYGDISGSKAPL